MKQITFRNEERDSLFAKEQAAALEKLKRRNKQKGYLDLHGIVDCAKHYNDNIPVDKLKRRCTCQHDRAAEVIDKNGLVHNDNCPVKEEKND